MGGAAKATLWLLCCGWTRPAARTRRSSKVVVPVVFGRERPRAPWGDDGLRLARPDVDLDALGDRELGPVEALTSDRLNADAQLLGFLPVGPERPCRWPCRSRHEEGGEVIEVRLGITDHGRNDGRQPLRSRGPASGFALLARRHVAQDNPEMAKPPAAYPRGQRRIRGALATVSSKRRFSSKPGTESPRLIVDPEDLERWVSPPWFAVYLEATGGDRQRAADLYLWSASVSAALMEDFHHLEVLLRNRIDSVLTLHTSNCVGWLHDANVLTPEALKFVVEAEGANQT